MVLQMSAGTRSKSDRKRSTADRLRLAARYSAGFSPFPGELARAHGTSHCIAVTSVIISLFATIFRASAQPCRSHHPGFITQYDHALPPAHPAFLPPRPRTSACTEQLHPGTRISVISCTFVCVNGHFAEELGGPPVPSTDANRIAMTT